MYICVGRYMIHIQSVCVCICVINVWRTTDHLSHRAARRDFNELGLVVVYIMHWRLFLFWGGGGCRSTAPSARVRV